MLVFLSSHLLLKKHCQEVMTGDVTQLVGSKGHSFPQFWHFVPLHLSIFEFKILILGAVCSWSMHGFLLSETLHVPLELDEDCSWCWVWILSSYIMHWELLRCTRELCLSGTLPQCSLDIYTLVPSHCQVSVCLGAALWADGKDKFNILGFSATLAAKARISVLSLHQASPVLAFFVVMKIGCVPRAWQNLVADSHGIQAGSVRDPWDVPQVCTGVPLHTLLTHSGRLSPAAQQASTSQRSWQQPVRICRQNLQAGPRYHSLPQCGASWQSSWCSLNPGFQLAVFSVRVLVNCESSTWSNIQLERLLFT